MKTKILPLLSPLPLLPLFCLLFAASCNAPRNSENQSVVKVVVADTVFASRLDSLKYVFENTNLPLFERLCIGTQLSSDLRSINIDKSIYYAQMCLKVSEKEKIDSITVLLKKTLVFDYSIKSADSAKMYLDELLLHALKNKDEDIESWVYNALGNVYSNQNNNLKAVEYYEKAMRITEKIGNYPRLFSGTKI